MELPRRMERQPLERPPPHALQVWPDLQPARDIVVACTLAVMEAAAPAGSESSGGGAAAAAWQQQQHQHSMLATAMANINEDGWASVFLFQLLPQLHAQAELVWQLEWLAAGSAAVAVRTERALQLRPCRRLLCTSVRGASEGRMRGRRCSCCAARFCCELCWAADGHSHVHG